MKNYPTDRLGINAVEKIFLQMGWIFREQSISDFGIDAQVEVKENGEPTGKLIALQIKSGTSYFKKKAGDYVYYGKQRHLDYWENHSLPVFLILYNPDTDHAIWQRIERRVVTMGRRKLTWSVTIPETNVLNQDAANYIAAGIASDPEAIRRFNLSFDASLIRDFSKRGVIYFYICEWLNKTLAFREVHVRFDELDKEEPDMVIHRCLPTHDLGLYMSRNFPWLDYEYAAPFKEHWGEFGEHLLKVEVGKIGQAFLALEEYYQKGIENPGTPTPPDPTADDMDEEEWLEYQFRCALEQDWEDEANGLT